MPCPACQAAVVPSEQQSPGFILWHCPRNECHARGAIPLAELTNQKATQ